jgi:hypothetical protein
MKNILASLTLAVSLMASTATAQRFGDWSVSISDDRTVVTAETANDSGNIFGLACFIAAETCYWVLTVGHSCTEGVPYLVLANAVSGASHHNLKCLIVKSNRFMVFQDFAAVETIVNNDARVGIAFPMENGLFTVMRFSLNGAKRAATEARSIAANAKKNDTGNLTL